MVGANNTYTPTKDWYDTEASTLFILWEAIRS